MSIQQIEVVLHGPEGVQDRKTFDVNDASVADDVKKFIDTLDVKVPKAEQKAAKTKPAKK